VLLHNPASLWSTSISTNEVNVGSGAGTFAVGVAGPGDWSWSAEAHGDFITPASPTHATGPGTATFTVQANSGFARQAIVNVAGQQVRVTQAGVSGLDNCVTEVRVQERWRALGGARTTQGTISAPPGCVWFATSTAPWISVTGASGARDGQFDYTVAPHLGADARRGSIVAGGKRADITELGCPYTMSAIDIVATAAGGTERVSLTGECTWAWTAVSEDAFVRIISGSRGAGNGVVTFTVAPNTGSAREGRLKIAGYTVKVTQPVSKP
jgi:hypothetical protein